MGGRKQCCTVASEPWYQRRLHEKQMSQLSNTEKVRVMLAKALFGKPENCCSMSLPTTLTLRPLSG